jgi:hypothetical protein
VVSLINQEVSATKTPGAEPIFQSLTCCATLSLFTKTTRSQIARFIRDIHMYAFGDSGNTHNGIETAGCAFVPQL